MLFYVTGIRNEDILFSCKTCDVHFYREGFINGTIDFNYITLIVHLHFDMEKD